MTALHSSWNVTGFGKTEANITLSTMFHHRRQSPIGLQFQCRRFSREIDPQMYPVFSRAVNGTAHLDMRSNPLCSHDNVLSGCGNRRNALTECRCEVLDRVAHPEIRLEYENQVIDVVTEQIKNQGQGQFHFKLAIFCSGELLGEEVLLFRLFQKLKEMGASGTLELFFIDRCYQSAIQGATHSTNFENAVGNQGYISQFLQEISKCAPSSVQITGAFFDDSESYIQLAKSRPTYQHHLLIGADIETANFDMGKIGKEAGCGQHRPITLIKTQDTPYVCSLDSNGTPKGCYNPTETHKRRKQSPSGDSNLPLIIGSVVAATLIGILAYHALSSSSKKQQKA